MQTVGQRLSRRRMMQVLLHLGAASGLGVPRNLFGASASPAEAPPARSGFAVSLSRFMMKADFPRLEVIAPAYRFIWHGRFFGFRLVSTVTDPYDERVSYANFGPFAVGGVDLLCNHYEPLTLTLPDGTPFRPGTGRLYSEQATASLPGAPNSFQVEHVDAQRRALRVRFGFRSESPVISLRFESSGFEPGSTLLLSWAAQFIYDIMRQADSSVAYYSRGARTGLRVTSSTANAVSIGESAAGKLITCRIPTDRPTEWTLEVLGPRDTLEAKPAAAPQIDLLATPKYQPVPLAELPSWEAGELARQVWKPPRGQTKERVAGLFVTAERWHSPTSWVPEATIDYVAKILLPKIIESRAFPAVGLSRDGVTEKGENPAWLGLVAQAHQSGLRVYMKPGDGELTAIQGKAAVQAWAKSCFDVPAEQRCDVVRMPWEAVLVPWTTANLCLAPRFHTPELAALSGLSWSAARKRIVTSVADRFSLIIESIRRHAPDIVVDLESADTTVLETLLARHDRLGVMYMAYGQFPRVAEYLDLYYCVARQQAKAARVVLETDCYYSHSITSLNQLQGRPYREIYSAQDIDLMRQKHRHLCRLAAEAAWSWGMNLTYTDAKFEAVCRAPLSSG